MSVLGLAEAAPSLGANGRSRECTYKVANASRAYTLKDGFVSRHVRAFDTQQEWLKTEINLQASKGWELVEVRRVVR
jgi:hypothetical protein